MCVEKTRKIEEKRQEPASFPWSTPHVCHLRIVTTQRLLLVVLTLHFEDNTLKDYLLFVTWPWGSTCILSLSLLPPSVSPSHPWSSNVTPSLPPSITTFPSHSPPSSLSKSLHTHLPPSSPSLTFPSSSSSTSSSPSSSYS